LIEARVNHQNFPIAPYIHYACKPRENRRSDVTLVGDKWKLVGFDLIPMRPNLSDERGICISRISDASHIDVTPQQSQKQMPSALPQCSEILDVRFNVQPNLRPSQPVGSTPPLKIIEANFRFVGRCWHSGNNPVLSGALSHALTGMPSRFNWRTRLARSTVKSGRARAIPAFRSIRSATTPGWESIDPSSPVD
jgi:hypothetical protein